MQAFQTFKGLVAPLDRSNIDTDQIIPKQFLKSIRRTGFGPNLFDEWRYLDQGELGQDHKARPINTNFVLNLPRYQGAQILLTRDNFGCGSSREHAPWALLDFGFKVVLAPSFADIFFNNCFKNGILPIVLDTALIDKIFQWVEAEEGFEIEVNLEDQTLVLGNGERISYDVEPFRKERLVKGLDDIGATLQVSGEIRAYEKKRKEETPWLFN